MRLIDADTIPYRSVYEPDENGKYRMVEFVYKEEVDKLHSYSSKSYLYIDTSEKDIPAERRK